METLTLRPLSASDFAAVAALARTVWQDTYPGIISQAQIDAMLAARYGEEALAAYLPVPGVAPTRWFTLACENETVLGFSGTECHQGEYKLDKLYVDPLRQRRGIGERLIEAAASHARTLGLATLMLAVNKQNAKAIAAYRKHGFSVRESVCVPIGNGFVMDDFIMQKSL